MNILKRFSTLAGFKILKIPSYWIDNRNIPNDVRVEDFLAGIYNQKLPFAFHISYRDKRFEIKFIVAGRTRTEVGAIKKASKNLEILKSSLNSTFHDFQLEDATPEIQKHNYSSGFYILGIPAIKENQLNGYVEAVSKKKIDSDFFVICKKSRAGIVEKWLAEWEYKNLTKSSRRNAKLGKSWKAKQKLNILEEKLERFSSKLKFKTYVYVCAHSDISLWDAVRKRDLLKSVIRTRFDSEEKKIWIRHVDSEKLLEAMRKLEKMGNGTLLKASELSAYINIPNTKMAGIEIQPKIEFPISYKANRGIEIGTILSDSNEELYQINFDPASIFEHAAIWGATGTGKSTLIKNLIVKLHNQSDLRFLIFDWHDEYREIVSALEGELGRDIFVINPFLTNFSINPLELPDVGGLERDIFVGERVENFISLIKQMFILGEIQESRIRKALYKIYNSDKPTIEDLIIELSTEKSNANLVSKLSKFIGGFYGEIFNKGHSTLPFEQLERATTIFELGRLPSELRTFFIGVFLILWWDYKRRKRANTPHVLVLDEFHHYSGLSVIWKMLSEARKYREGLICAHQGPDQLTDKRLLKNLVRNTATKLIFRLEQATDKQIVSAALGGLNKDQAEYLSLMDVGEAVVKLKGMKHPLRIKTPPLPELDRIEDEKIKQIFKIFNSTDHSPTNQYIEVTAPFDYIERKFLEVVLRQANIPTYEVARALKIKISKGIELREKLKSKNLLVEEKVRIGTGRPKQVLKLSEKGLQLFKLSRIKNMPAHYGKEEHVSTVRRIAKCMEDMGWHALIEFEGSDIKAQKGGSKIAIEVETGKSKAKDQMIRNIKRDLLWADRIIVACPNNRIKASILKTIEQQKLKKTILVSYNEIKDLKNFLP